MSVGKQVSAINGSTFFTAYDALSACFDWAAAVLLLRNFDRRARRRSALRVRRLPAHRRDGGAALARSHFDLAVIHLAFDGGMGLGGSIVACA
jgi:hypothetical protein